MDSHNLSLEAHLSFEVDDRHVLHLVAIWLDTSFTWREIWQRTSNGKFAIGGIGGNMKSFVRLSKLLMTQLE